MIVSLESPQQPECICFFLNAVSGYSCKKAYSNFFWQWMEVYNSCQIRNVELVSGYYCNFFLNVYIYIFFFRMWYFEIVASARHKYMVLENSQARKPYVTGGNVRERINVIFYYNVYYTYSRFNAIWKHEPNNLTLNKSYPISILLLIILLYEYFGIWRQIILRYKSIR